jgi:hypothetical protein
MPDPRAVYYHLRMHAAEWLAMAQTAAAAAR